MAINPSTINWPIITFASWFLVSYIYHGLGITLGYHRLLTHKSLKVPQWLMYLIVSGGYLCLMGSPIVWVGVHRLHHQKSDLPGDPHSPRDGFWHSMFGWMVGMEKVQSSESLRRQVPDLMADKVFRALGDSHSGRQAMQCLATNIAFRVGIFALFGWIPCLANTLAMLILFVSTQFVNAICHMPGWGYRSFDSKDDSLNVWWVAILTLGEGWHNNHHGIPNSARHGLSWWEVDVTWITTDILQKLGLATDIILPPKGKTPRPTFKRDNHRKTAKQLSR